MRKKKKKKTMMTKGAASKLLSVFAVVSRVNGGCTYVRKKKTWSIIVMQSEKVREKNKGSTR